MTDQQTEQHDTRWAFQCPELDWSAADRFRAEIKTLAEYRRAYVRLNSALLDLAAEQRVISGT